MAGRVYLCLVAGNTVWQVTPRSSEMDSHEELYAALTFFCMRRSIQLPRVSDWKRHKDLPTWPSISGADSELGLTMPKCGAVIFYVQY